ncbi:MarR family winged helix-turn-helix transcriptional regulator [Modestobacter sp. NPDC049651]|uniref:MarR family winged helix-turn-helix transcriptional regulator n=1 Tax=unclassified Modestobacter TaxID=2643866 RepID=UPI0033C94E2C
MDVEAAVAALEEEMAGLWRRGRSRIRDAARAVDPQLDPASYPLLTVLVRRGPTRVSDLGAALDLDKSTVSRQVDAAARLGLVDRVPDPADARVRLVTLTELGHRQMDAVHTQRLARWRASLATWEADDLQQLTALLRRLQATGLT